METKTMTQKERILSRLEDGSATSVDLNSICYRYGARIADLRKEGYEIYTSYVKPGVFKYELETR